MLRRSVDMCKLQRIGQWFHCQWKLHSMVIGVSIRNSGVKVKSFGYLSSLQDAKSVLVNICKCLGTKIIKSALETGSTISAQDLQKQQ